ncbi:FAD-dependent monooxygenase [Methylocystis sp.]|uniref:FAD-dependent monooxygenase n=1 Tax=Methylocystis sp. TaxID=1911079 RepID=UPI00273731B6|nr:FAD-dependent monooxygenase [Methylocystis sp.]MDP3554320.1 FAD-dependent monooxygenase [Methylocystis sp.]
MNAPIVIAGAGIGGLAAALSLARAGKRTLVLERAARIDEVGAGLQIAPNAGRILAKLGLEPALAAVALEPEAINIRRGRDGAILARLDLSAARTRWGAPFRLFHRADLQGALLQAALDNPQTHVRAGARVGDFEATARGVRLRVHTQDGVEEIEAAGLIGADGVRSSVRGHLVPSERDAPAYSGCVAWRATLPAESVPAALRVRESNLWLLPGAHVVHYPLRDASLINAVVIIEEPPEAEDAGSSLSLKGAALTRRLAPRKIAAELRDLIEAGDSWRHWPLFTRPALEHWTQGPVTLLGDAAHPMVPFLAQGAAQAIEDADALGESFMRLGATVETAFAAYEGARLPRADRVVGASRRQGGYFHMGGLPAAARNLAIRALGGRGMLARNAWLYR